VAGNGVLFTTERTGLARGFTLGTVRVGGKHVLSDAAKPIFAPSVRAADATLPQHEGLTCLGSSGDGGGAAAAEGQLAGVQADSDGGLDSAAEERDSGGGDTDADGGQMDGGVIAVSSEDEDGHMAEEQGEQFEGDASSLHDVLPSLAQSTIRVL
jgi:hypothetical protein